MPDCQGIDVAAVSEHQPLFDLEAGQLGNIGGAILLELYRAQGQFQAGVVTQEKALHQALDMLLGDETVEDGGKTGFGFVDDDEGLGKTEAHTSYLDDMGLNAFFLYPLAKVLEGI